MIHEDLLKTDWRNWFDLLGGPFLLVGNLPYHISTPVLFKIIDHRDIVEGAYVMLQKEVADRSSGKPGQKTYRAADGFDRLLRRSKTAAWP